MGTSAHAHDEPPPTRADPALARVPHLRLVNAEDLPALAAQAAAETGQDKAVMLGVLAGALLSQVPAADLDLPSGSSADPTPDEARQMLHIAGALEASLRHFMDALRAFAPAEASSSDVRQHWSHYLDRVHARDETIYVTSRGARIAALVPPYVAEHYDAEQAWYHSAAWRAKEQEADRDIGEGRVTRVEGDHDMLLVLDKLGERD